MSVSQSTLWSLSQGVEINAFLTFLFRRVNELAFFGEPSGCRPELGIAQCAFLLQLGDFHLVILSMEDIPKNTCIVTNQINLHTYKKTKL